MKKYLSVFLLSLFITSCQQQDTTAQQTAKEAQILDKETVFSFDVSNLQTGCDNKSELICTINTTIKCILNPHFSECKTFEKQMPSYVFMEDESLIRPTFQSYKITKLVPLNDGSIEVHTQSSCNGNWFGLCNGNIIYVMRNIDSKWIITNMYALEF